MRGYKQDDLLQSWQAYFMGFNPFAIGEADDFRKQMGKKPVSKFEMDFEEAKRMFDSETHESMTRKPIKTKDLPKIMNPAKVVLATLLITGMKKSVDRLVR